MRKRALKVARVVAPAEDASAETLADLSDVQEVWVRCYRHARDHGGFWPNASQFARLERRVLTRRMTLAAWHDLEDALWESMNGAKPRAPGRKFRYLAPHREAA